MSMPNGFLRSDQFDGLEPDTNEVANFIGDLSQEMEALASTAGLTSLAAYLRAAAWEARSLRDADPSRFRKV
jgi:hypothetical protein